MDRRALACLAVAVSLAFAPAPFPKPAKDSVAVKDVAGTWRPTEFYFLINKTRHTPASQGITHVVISPTKWVFKGPGGATYDLRIDHTRKPATFDLMKPGQKEPYGRGLIRRDGRTVQVLYEWGARPTGFEGQSAGCLMTMVRD